MPDGKVRLDRVPGEKGYWDNPSATSLVEKGVHRRNSSPTAS